MLYSDAQTNLKFKLVFINDDVETLIPTLKIINITEHCYESKLSVLLLKAKSNRMLPCDL